jgi:hypothetical protein
MKVAFCGDCLKTRDEGRGTRNVLGCDDGTDWGRTDVARCERGLERWGVVCGLDPFLISDLRSTGGPHR